MWLRLFFIYLLTIFLMLKVSAITLLNCACGRANDEETQRIVGGTDVTFQKYPWIAHLEMNGNPMCAGILINDRDVLTVGHCFNNPHELNFNVHLGTYLTNKGIKHKPLRVIKHEHYKEINDYSINDIALVRLSEKIKFDPNVRPICLPNPKSNFSKHNATIIGWGAHNSGTFSNNLKETQVQIMTDKFCQESEISERYQKTTICAFRENKDACQGDSGGPLMYQNPKGFYELVGIVSWGIECASSAPAIYTKVSTFIDWIGNNTRGAYYCKIH